MEILLSDENGYLDLRQEIGHLINAIVAVLGPELSPGSTFFSRCKVCLCASSNFILNLFYPFGALTIFLCLYFILCIKKSYLATKFLTTEISRKNFGYINSVLFVLFSPLLQK